MLTLLFGCLSGQPEEQNAVAPESAVVVDEKRLAAPKGQQQTASAQHRPGHQNRPQHPNGPGKGQGKMMPKGSAGSGAMMQDPSGFPMFHDWPAPPGPAISQLGGWTAPLQLSSKPSGGYRPQLAVAPSGELHAVYYDRQDAGDIIRHRRSMDGKQWTDPVRISHESERNWGPDIVAREDGSVVVVYDHALKDFSSRGYMVVYDDGVWSQPEAITPEDGGEIGSGHVANGLGDELAYVYIAKALGAEHKFQARGKWYRDGKWSEVVHFSDGSKDAWHTNVERRTDGSVMFGFDIGTGGSATTLYLGTGSSGQFYQVENVTSSGRPGERPHFAFAKDRDVVTWFHKQGGKPQHIYVRAREKGIWGAVEEPSAGYGGFHFDPEIAVNADGVLCLVWGWDAGQDAEMVYSINDGAGWSKPAKIADINWGKPGLSSIDVDQSGAFHVVWNQGVRGTNEVYYAKLEVTK